MNNTRTAMERIEQVCMYNKLLLSLLEQRSPLAVVEWGMGEAVGPERLADLSLLTILYNAQVLLNAATCGIVGVASEVDLSTERSREHHLPRVSPHLHAAIESLRAAFAELLTSEEVDALDAEMEASDKHAHEHFRRLKHEAARYAN